MIKDIANYKNLDQSKKDEIKNRLKKIGVAAGIGVSGALIGTGFGYFRARDTFMGILGSIKKVEPEFDYDSFLDIWNNAVEEYFG